jgi:hypothetical protein
MALARTRLASAMLGLCLMLAGAAEAQVKRSLPGSELRFQIGGELQIPIAATKLVQSPFRSSSATVMVPASCLPRGGSRASILPRWPR